jgi:hypothetical protein
MPLLAFSSYPFSFFFYPFMQYYVAAPFEWRCISATDRSIRQTLKVNFLKSEIVTEGQIKLFSYGI